MERINLPTIVGEMKIKDYGVFRRRVMDECGISRTTFYQWRCGRSVCFYIQGVPPPKKNRLALFLPNALCCKSGIGSNSH